ncbi:MAG: hypothetical protein LBC27_07855 [Spirochaetaceae bacterium]|jgi:hypothetical protein|nr:hypothetical protein [Spirochaetaceae bacterium]
MLKDEFINTIKNALKEKSFGDEFILRDLLKDSGIWSASTDAQKRGLGKMFWTQQQRGTFDGDGKRIIAIEMRSNPQGYRVVKDEILLKTATPSELHAQCLAVGWEKVIEAHVES